MRLTLLLLASATLAQGLDFELPRLITDYVDRPDRVMAADLDGDGDQDLVVMSRKTRLVTWHENRKGIFRQAGVMDLFPGYTCELADFDGDGLPDLLLERPDYTAPGPDVVDSWILFGSGIEGFGPREQRIENIVTSEENSLVVDVDGGGLPDLLLGRTVVLNPGSDQPIRVSIPSGTVFSPRPEDPPNIRWYDWTGDGRMDAYDMSRGVWWENTGGGTFSAELALPLGQLPEYHRSLQLLRDERLPEGKGTLHLAKDPNDPRVVMLTLSSATGEPLASLPVPGRTEGWEIFAYLPVPESSDFIAVVKREHLLPTGGYEDVYDVVRISLVFRRDQLSLLMKTAVSGLRHEPGALALADLNKDRQRDLLIGSGSPQFPGEPVIAAGRLSWHKGNAKGVFSAKGKEVLPPATSDVLQDLVDLNGDEDLDVISSGQSPLTGESQIAWWENSGEGTSFKRQVLLSSPGTLNYGAAVDLSGDGRRDVLAQSFEPLPDGSYRHRLLLSRGSKGAKRATITLLTTTGPHRRGTVAADDWDGDGMQDIIFAESTGFTHRTRWMKGLPKGKFAAAADLTETGAFALYDMDGDGDPDLAPVPVFSDANVWFENAGPGLAPVRRTIDQSTAVYPAFADLNLDGRLDFIMDRTPLLAQAGGGFTSLPPFPLGYRVSFTDLDQDGDGDAVVFSNSSSNFGPAENTGGGSFAEGVFLQGTAFATWDRALAGDIDGDGKTDLVTSTVAGRARIVWFKGK